LCKKLEEFPALAMKAYTGIRGISAFIFNIRSKLNASLHVDFVRKGR
jgi:hypothetical protein